MLGRVDDETENWPIPIQHKPAWDRIKYTHKVQPLMAFNIDNKLIGPLQMVATRPG